VKVFVSGGAIMAAIEQEILEQIRKLDPAQKKQVLEFAQHLRIVHLNAENNPEDQAWTDEEIQALMIPKRKSMKETIAWLDANPPTEEWGGMRPEDDAADYIHNMRQQNDLTLEDPGETP
jgi:hypothetical protein